MAPATVMIIGSATIDRIVQGNLTKAKIGGVVTYAGLTFRKHGIPAIVRSNISIRDQKIIRLFRGNQIHLVNGPTFLTTRFINHLEGDFRWQEVPRRARRIRIDPAMAELRAAGHIHLGPLYPDDLHPDSLAVLAGKGRFVTLDVQGYVRQIRGTRVLPRVSKHLEQALKTAQVIKASSREMEAILDTYQVDAGGLQERFSLKEILITSGARGGIVFCENGESVEYKAVPAGRVIDTTGAGDVFFAAYLIRRYYESASVSDAVRHASQTAAEQVCGQYIQPESLQIH